MNKKIRNAIPFLVLVLLIPIGLANAQEIPGQNDPAQEPSQTESIYDPVMVQYMKELTADPGKTVTERLIANQTVIG